MHLLGKTLKGNPKQFSKYEILVTDGVNPKYKLENNLCDSGSLAIKFVSLACPGVNNEDYNVEIIFTFLGVENTYKGIASASKNCSIKVYVFGKFDIKSIPLPLPFPIPPIIEDVFLDIKLSFNKVPKKCEYEISGEAKLSVDISVGNFNLDVNSIAIAKSGNFKFN